MAATNDPIPTAPVLGILRHIFGYGFLLPFLILLILVQALIVAPLTGNRKTIPHLIYRACGWIFGIRYRLNPESAGFDDDRLTLFVSNHLARIDFAALFLFPDAAVMMNDFFFKVPIAGQVVKLFATSAGLIGTNQTPEGKTSDLANLTNAALQGRDIFVFPEGIQTDGTRLLRYSKGSAEIFFDDHAPKALKSALIQPVVMRVAEIKGRNVMDPAKDWEAYTLTRRRTSIFANMTRRAMVPSIVVDILVLPAKPLAGFDDAAHAMNDAHSQTLRFIAPEQETPLTRAQWQSLRDSVSYRSGAV